MALVTFIGVSLGEGAGVIDASLRHRRAWRIPARGREPPPARAFGAVDLPRKQGRLFRQGAPDNSLPCLRGRVGVGAAMSGYTLPVALRSNTVFGNGVTVVFGPAPASSSLLGLGGLMAARRRRRCIPSRLTRRGE